VINQYLFLIEARSRLAQSPQKVIVQTTHFWKRYSEEGHGTNYAHVTRFGRRNGNKPNFVFGRDSQGTVSDTVSLLLIPLHLGNVSDRLRTIFFSTYTSIEQDHWALLAVNFEVRLFMNFFHAVCTHILTSHFNAHSQQHSVTYFDSLYKPQMDDEVISTGDNVLEKMMHYLNCEHESYGVPFDRTIWTTINTLGECPQQENGNDCGVFMLVMCDYLALKLTADFDTSHMDAFREIIGMSILTGIIV
jgi:Ulp1 protease family, C-terminal catalytic domain